MPRVWYMALYGKPIGSHVFTKLSLVSLPLVFRSGLFALKSFCAAGVSDGASPSCAEIGPVQKPFRSRFGAWPPGPLFNLFLRTLPPVPPRAGGVAGDASVCARATD